MGNKNLVIAKRLVALAKELIVAFDPKFNRDDREFGEDPMDYPEPHPSNRDEFSSHDLLSQDPMYMWLLKAAKFIDPIMKMKQDGVKSYNMARLNKLLTFFKSLYVDFSVLDKKDVKESNINDIEKDDRYLVLFIDRLLKTISLIKTISNPNEANAFFEKVIKLGAATSKLAKTMEKHAQEHLNVKDTPEALDDNDLPLKTHSRPLTDPWPD